LEFINIYLPFANSKKELTFDREIELIIDKDNDMEALTIRQLYDRKIREDGDKLYKKELRRHQKTESRLQEEARMLQEETRMRQEEARMRQEKLAISVIKLHNQGFSPESIADVLLESLETVQVIINRHPSV
jgi:actin-related protein